MLVKKNKRTKKNTPKNSIGFKIFNAFLVVSFFVFILIGGVVAYAFTKLPELEVDNMIRPNDSYVYDKDDKLIGRISRKEENQENITYNQLNQSIINSLVGTEDSTFFTHKGIDVLSTVEKTVQALTKTGNNAGGSSITQQIIGWSHLDRNDKSYTRKLEEILLSLKAEKEVNKEDIITMYLNYFFYGKNNIHGIEKASEYFFDKKASSLDYVQAAMMSGTLNAPILYNPLGGYNEETKKYLNSSQERLGTVLISNLHKGYLSPAEYYLLQQVKVENEVNINDSNVTTAYGAYIDVVKKEMETKYGIDFKKSSLNIYTNMDKKAQRQANNITNNKVSGLELPDKDMNFGFIMTGTQNGKIIAVGGGKQYKGGKSMLLNNAIDLRNQPGSAFKPIIAYSPTFEFLHWSDRAPISNAPYKYPGTNISIRNVDGTSGGVLTIDQALASSRNLTAVRAMEAVVNKVGFAGLNNYLTKLGFEFTDDELTYAYALGGTNTGVSPYQMNGAYQAFGNGGKFIEPWTVRSYVNIDTGKKVTNPTKPVQAIDEKTAFMISNSLERSTKSSILLGAVGNIGVPYSAKTGTSDWGKAGLQYGIPEYSPKDSWCVGYTNEYTLSVWSGFDAKGIKKGKYPQWGNQHDYAAMIFGNMMRTMVDGKETSYLDQKPPKGIVSGTLNTSNTNSYTTGGVSAWFYDDNTPTGNSLSNDKLTESDFKTTVTYDGNGIINFQFKDVQASGVSYYVQIGDEYANKAGNYKIRNGQSYTAYYIYKGEVYGQVNGCIKDNKLSTSGCRALN